MNALSEASGLQNLPSVAGCLWLLFCLEKVKSPILQLLQSCAKGEGAGHAHQGMMLCLWL